MDIRKIKTPGYYWKYVADSYEIIHLVERISNEYIVKWRFSFFNTSKSVEVIRFRYCLNSVDMRNYEPINTLSIEKKKMAFDGIFNSLKIIK